MDKQDLNVKLWSLNDRENQYKARGDNYLLVCSRYK